MLATPDCSIPIRRVRDKEVWIGISLLEFLGLAAERTGTMRDTDRSRERCWTEELGNGLGCLSPLTRLWCRHHLSYDQTKYVVEQARRHLALQPPAVRRRTVERLAKAEVERFIVFIVLWSVSRYLLGA
jgi:hypothetical protein